MDSKKEPPPKTDVEDSNPNAAGPQGLRGDMGVSSERSGRLLGDESESVSEDGEGDGSGIQGTGSRGTAASSTQGTLRTSGAADEADDSDSQSEGSESDAEGELSMDRTAGESNTAEVPSHDFDPTRNPGHSHG